MSNGKKATIFAILALLAFVLIWQGYRHRLSAPPPVVQVPVSDLPKPVVTVQAPQAAIVIDDVAYSMSIMDHFAQLGIPLTFAMLPRHKLAKPLSEKALSLQFAVILHLPMEPHDVVHNDPGPSGLYLRMSERELKAQFDKAVESVPNIVGINNHMGSAFTEDAPRMRLVLGWAKQRGFYFLDSYTSTKSVVVSTAREVGIPCLRNETFLDNEDSLESIEKQLDVVMKLALQRKKTIAIGHYRRKYIVEALAKKIPEFKAHGIEFVTLTSLYPS